MLMMQMKSFRLSLLIYHWINIVTFVNLIKNSFNIRW